MEVDRLYKKGKKKHKILSGNVVLNQESIQGDMEAQFNYSIRYTKSIMTQTYLDPPSIVWGYWC